MSNTRRHLRRSLDTGRTAVLVVGRRSHVVGLVDVSLGGAYLSTRVEAQPGQALALKLLLPGRWEMTLACELVRRSDSGDEAAGRPPGLAVRFRDLDAEATRRLEQFVAAGFLSASPGSDSKTACG